MKRIGMGLVGAGFVGPHHVDAVRRLGYVDIVAVAGSNDASGQAKAEALGAHRGYGSYQALIDDPAVHHRLRHRILGAGEPRQGLRAGRLPLDRRRLQLRDLHPRRTVPAPAGSVPAPGNFLNNSSTRGE